MCSVTFHSSTRCCTPCYCDLILRPKSGKTPSQTESIHFVPCLLCPVRETGAKCEKVEALWVKKRKSCLKKGNVGGCGGSVMCVGGQLIRSWLIVKGKVKEMSRRSGGCGGQKNSTEHQSSSHELPVVLLFHAKM